MRRIVCILLFACFCCFVSAQSKLDSVINKLGNDFIKEKEAVGLSIGLLKDGKISYYNFGATSHVNGRLPTENTIYEIGSVTKTFVSFILANAVLEQKLNLNDDIRKYLDEPYPNLEYQGEPVRLVHLANTTSLLPDWLPEIPAGISKLPADSALLLKTNYYKGLTGKDLLKALRTVKIDTVPGTKTHHSNAAAQLLAYILEKVYQMPMDKLIAKYISIPFKMKNTSFPGRGKVKGLATGYTSEGKIAAYESVMPYFQYAGGLRSSASDMTAYLKAFVESANKAAILSTKKTVDIDASNGNITTMRPESIAAPEVYSVCLNWLKYQPEATGSQVWADGGTNGFNSYAVIYPYQKSGIVLLANKSSEKIFRGLPGIAYEISKAIEKK